MPALLALVHELSNVLGLICCVCDFPFLRLLSSTVILVERRRHVFIPDQVVEATIIVVIVEVSVAFQV